MIPISALPDLPWTDNSQLEIENAGAEALFSYTDTAWQFGNVLVVGLCYNSFVQAPWLWFALTKNVKFKDLIDFRYFQTMIPEGTMTAVAEDFAVGHRFAKFYGFKPTGGAYDLSGRSYLLYRKT